MRENQKEMNRADMTFNSPKEDCDSGNLVKLLDVDDDFIVELRYATEDNFTGKRVYESAECYIDRETLKMLIEARDVPTSGPHVGSRTCQRPDWRLARSLSWDPW